MQNLYHLDCIVCEAVNTDSENYAKKCLDEANRETFLDAISEAVSCEDKQEAFTRIYCYAKHYFDLRKKYQMPVTDRAKNSMLKYIEKTMKKENVTLDAELIAGIDKVLVEYESNKLHCN